MAVEFPVRANTQGAERDIDQLIAALRKAGRQAGMTEKEIDEITKATRKVGDEGPKQINKLNQSLNGLGGAAQAAGKAFMAALAFDVLKDATMAVVNITAEFQKFEAVLTNTLGSRSAAQAAMKQIQDFASKTPFSVRELTDSFVRLANQGFKPTADQMRKLGDLAASTGKSFDQLTEAIIDAQTGEFERLKEFGIRASKEGDRVAFTFKGIKREVDFTNDSIREYILGLGDAQGVSGAMAAISETLGGQISNLGDSWDTLLNTLGDSNNGRLSLAIAAIKDLIDQTTQWVKTTEQVEFDEEQANKLLGRQQFIEFAKQFDDINEAYDQYYQNQVNLIPTTSQLTNEQVKQNKAIKAQIQGVQEYFAELEKQEDEAGYKAFLKTQDEARKAEEERMKVEKKRLEDVSKAYEDLIRLAKKFTDDQQDAFARSLVGAEQGVIEGVQRAGTPGQSIFDPSFVNPNFEPEQTQDIDSPTLAEIEARKRALRQETFDHAVGLTNQLAEMTQAGYQMELSALEYRYAEEMRMAGNNEDAKAAITKRFAAERLALQQKQMESENRQALFNIAIQQGPAVAKTISQNGFPLALPLVLLVAGQFAALIAQQQRVRPPRLAATGEFDIDGPGHETSDSIPYLLSQHESVVHAKGTRKFGDILKPIIENPDLEWHHLARIVDSKLPTGYVNVVRVTQGADTPALAEELRKTRKAIERKAEVQLSIDEHGFHVSLKKGETWNRYVANRYPVFK